MFKKNILIYSITFLFVLILSVAMFVHFNNNEIEKTTWDYWLKGDDRRGDKVIQRAREINKTRTYVLQHNGFFEYTSQVVTYFETLEGGSTSLDFETFYLERTGVSSFKVKESFLSSSTAFSFEEAVEIAKKYDVYKNNPYPDKILNFENNPESIFEPTPSKGYTFDGDYYDFDSYNYIVERIKTLDEDQKSKAIEVYDNCVAKNKILPVCETELKLWLDQNYPEE
jgi:hypothetical protein